MREKDPPHNLHPALADAYFLKPVVYKDEKKKIWDEMQQVIPDQRRFGSNEAIELVMETCTTPIPDLADFIGHFQLSWVPKGISWLSSGQTGLETIHGPQILASSSVRSK